MQDDIIKEFREKFNHIPNKGFIVGKKGGYYDNCAYDISCVGDWLKEKLSSAISQAKEEGKAITIEKNFDDFLNYYYKTPCPGCGHHNSMWATIVESEEWKEWKKVGLYDFSECDELGIMSERHFKDFLKFTNKNSKEEGRKQGVEETLNTPMGISQWIEHGRKYGYDEYLLEEYKKELREKIEKEFTGDEKIDWIEQIKIRILYLIK